MAMKTPASRPYRKVFDGEVPALGILGAHGALEDIFHIHNSLYRPRGTEIRSLSIGDVIHIPESKETPSQWYLCESIGWREFSADELVLMTFEGEPVR